MARMGSFPGLPDYVLRQALHTLREAAPVSTGAPAHNPVEQLTEALQKLRGNRSYTATYVRADGALVPLREQPSPRVASKRALWRFVATASVDEALAEFDRVHAQYPTSSEPYNYRGELYLYLGDTVTARRQFERALELYVLSRWAYIGLAGAAVIEGRYEEALIHLQRGIDRAGTPGPTAYAYRGEAYRGLGRLDLARSDLEHAVNTHPLRIGAWVNLGLVQAAQGDEVGLSATLAQLSRRAPGLVADAGEGLSDAPSTALLEAMLTLLRGNRASACVTYFTRDGRLRAVAPST
jgi:tetratricopeptide (TPR) repeat protein